MNLGFQWSKCGRTTLDLRYGSHGFSKSPSPCRQPKHHEKLPQSFCRNSLKTVVCLVLCWHKTYAKGGQEVPNPPLRPSNEALRCGQTMECFSQKISGNRGAKKSSLQFETSRSQMQHFLRRHLVWGVESWNVSWKFSNQREPCPAKWCATVTVHLEWFQWCNHGAIGLDHVPSRSRGNKSGNFESLFFNVHLEYVC